MRVDERLARGVVAEDHDNISLISYSDTTSVLSDSNCTVNARPPGNTKSTTPSAIMFGSLQCSASKTRTRDPTDAAHTRSTSPPPSREALDPAAHSPEVA